MRNKLFLIGLPSISIPLIVISSCATPTLLCPMPTSYFIINGSELSGFKDEYLETTLKTYNTLQIPDNITYVHGFIGNEQYAIYDSIQYIQYSDKGKWNKIGDTGVAAFANLPNLKSIKLPSTITSIANNAFINLQALETIDISDMDNVAAIKPTCFVNIKTNGTFVVKSDTIKNNIKNLFKDHLELKTWSINVKK